MRQLALNLIYALLLILASPWLLYQSLTTGKYRRGWREKLFGTTIPRTDDVPCIWFHAVSVGEVNLLEPIISRIRKLCPDATLVISTTTKTGRELAAKKFSRLQRFQFPFDFTWAVNRTLDSIKPDVLVLAELEIWPNLVAQCRKRSIKTGVVNARLSENSFRGYQRLRRFLQPVFASLDFVLAQNETYADRFHAMGTRPGTISVTGSVKFDGGITDRDNLKTNQLAELAGIGNEDLVFLAGSTQEPEEIHALETFRQLHKQHPALKLILVPRHPERFESVADMLDNSEFDWSRRSQLTEPGQASQQEQRILLVDTIGELGSWWGTAGIAFVGGSFGNRGGQNMIEPAAYGAAVCFGPNTKNFRDIVSLLLGQNAAVRIQTPDELTTFVSRCLTEPGYREELGCNAQRTVISQQGAADITARMIAAQITSRVNEPVIKPFNEISDPQRHRVAS